MEQLLTVSQVAELLQVSSQTVIRRINKGELKGVKVGRFWRISKDNLKDYLERVKQVWLGLIGAYEQSFNHVRDSKAIKDSGEHLPLLSR